MTNLTTWLKELNPFNFSDTIKQQEDKDRRIKRLEKVNGYVDKKVSVRKNYLVEHTEKLEKTVRNALDSFDTFKGKHDE